MSPSSEDHRNLCAMCPACAVNATRADARRSLQDLTGVAQAGRRVTCALAPEKKEAVFSASSHLLMLATRGSSRAVETHPRRYYVQLANPKVSRQWTLRQVHSLSAN